MKIDDMMRLLLPQIGGVVTAVLRECKAPLDALQLARVEQKVSEVVRSFLGQVVDIDLVVLCEGGLDCFDQPSTNWPLDRPPEHVQINEVSGSALLECYQRLQERDRATMLVVIDALDGTERWQGYAGKGPLPEVVTTVMVRHIPSGWDVTLSIPRKARRAQGI